MNTRWTWQWWRLAWNTDHAATEITDASGRWIRVVWGLYRRTDKPRKRMTYSKCEVFVDGVECEDVTDAEWRQS